jgi:hypothetical protein
MENLHDDSYDLYKHVGAGCQLYYKIALDASTRVIAALKHSSTLLHELELQHERREAFATARTAERFGTPVGSRTCDEAEDLVGTLGPGSGRHNHVVCWAPPPPPPVAVEYVGRSRALDQRCADHPEERSDHMTTLNLPPLDLQNARNVEEALIAHFGPENATRNGTILQNGQLLNQRHEISPLRATYCERLLVGQAILQDFGYGAYAAAFYTFNISCPGVGGPH